jgi:hypothetical protein
LKILHNQMRQNFFAFWIYLRSFYSIYFVLVCFFKAELHFENNVQTMQL